MTNFREIVVDACPRGELKRTLDFACIMAKVFDARRSVASYAWPKMAMTDVLAPSFFWAEERRWRWNVHWHPAGASLTKCLRPIGNIFVAVQELPTLTLPCESFS